MTLVTHIIKNFKTASSYPKTDNSLERLIDRPEEIQKRSRFTLFATILAFLVFIGCACFAYWGGIESLEARMLLSLGLFLSGAVTLTGFLAGIATLGTVLTVFQLHSIKLQTDVAESMEEEQMLLDILFRVREKRPEDVDGILEREEFKKPLTECYPELFEKINFRFFGSGGSSSAHDSPINVSPEKQRSLASVQE